MKTFIVSDWHLNHMNIATYCDRPKNFTDMIIKRHNERVTYADTVIMCGDVGIGPPAKFQAQIRAMNGKKILIRGNHDRKKSNSWWMDNGFDFSCDGLIFANCWVTHEPAASRAGGCELNVHGHLHNIWHGFHPYHGDMMNAEWMRLKKELKNPWQRLFAIEYTNYYPIEFEEFITHPDRYQSRGPTKLTHL